MICNIFFQDFLYSFPIRRYHDSWHNVKGTVCYKNAVFGYYRKNFDWKELRNYLGTSYGFQECDRNVIKVTILNRLTRRILNAEELRNATLALGLKNVEIHTFEGKSLIEQYRIIYCTDILIGVQGAGLGWIYLLRHTSGLIELAWPKYKWGFRYKGRAKGAKIQVETLSAKRVQPNWEVYMKNEHIMHKLSETEKQKLKNVRKMHMDSKSIYKWADGYFDPKEFQNKFKLLLKKMKRNTFPKASLQLRSKNETKL